MPPTSNKKPAQHQHHNNRPPRRRRHASKICGCSALVCSATAAAIVAAAAAAYWRGLLPAIASNSTNATVVDDFDNPALRVAGSLNKNVYERDLVSRHISPRVVLHEHAGFYFNVSRRLSPGLCLGFVSPWSARGEEVAWRFGSKLTHLSPIMFGVDQLGNLIPHEKPRWLRELREGLTCPGCPPPAKLVPLVSLRGLDFATFFAADDTQEERAGRLLFALLQQHVTLELDGLVIDAHQHLARLDRATRLAVAPKLHIFIQCAAAAKSAPCHMRPNRPQ